MHAVRDEQSSGAHRSSDASPQSSPLCAPDVASDIRATLPAASSPFIVCSGLVKIFQVADLEVVALQGLDLEVAHGEMLALVGPSGSGKSTLLHILGGLDRPSAGQVNVDDLDLLQCSQADITAYRRRQVGFVWQQTTRNLLPYLSARENIELLMTLSGQPWRERRRWTDELLAAVGMIDHAHQTPPQLSGGQQQRIAIACALANRPKILLGDELSGEIDWSTAQMILTLLRRLREQFQLTIILVTHDPRVAEKVDRVVAIRDGRTSTETLPGTASNAAFHPQEVLPSGFQPANAEEVILLDQAGRLQLPDEQRALAGIGRRARVELVAGGVLIKPDERGLTRMSLTEKPSNTDPEYHRLYQADTAHGERVNAGQRAPWWARWGKHRR